jgi:YidC/Oxa1 family membrane protein insertase
LALEIGEQSGMVRRASLKNFKNSKGTGAVTFGGETPLISVGMSDTSLVWTKVQESASSVLMEAKDSNGRDYQVSYSIDSESPIMQLEITQKQSSDVSSDSEVIVQSVWEKGEGPNDRYATLEATILEKKDSGGKHKKFSYPLKKEKGVPRGTLITLSERYFCQSLKPVLEPVSVRLLASSHEGQNPTAQHALSQKAVVELRGQLVDSGDGVRRYAVLVYLGPRDYFLLEKAGFGSSFPIGILGQIGLILLTILNFISGVTKSYGVAIILFSCLVTCMTAPFTLMSFKSMKKMQELTPTINKIKEKHKDDPERMNREIFALWKEHRVSPMTGCLPMLLQFPILIALYQAISHFIALRGESFLWIKDLSMPDRVATFPFSLPLLGDSLNLLPIIMAVVMFLQTKLSQAKMGQTQNNPASQMMSGPFMSVLFGFMFYNIQSALVLYWLTNSLLSLLWYRLAK